MVGLRVLRGVVRSDSEQTPMCAVHNVKHTSLFSLNIFCLYRQPLVAMLVMMLGRTTSTLLGQQGFDDVKI